MTSDATGAQPIASATTIAIGIVVVTHGRLAAELVNAAEMVVGSSPVAPLYRSGGTTM